MRNRSGLKHALGSAIMVFLGAWALIGAPATASPLKSDENIIFFPTSAYWNDGWVLPIHGWVFEAERGSLWRKGARKLIRHALELDFDDHRNPYFKQRATLFLVDNERDKQIRVKVGGRVASMDRSKPNGHFKGNVTLRTKRAERLAGNAGWISYEAVLSGRDRRRFQGEVQLVSPEGISIISDIDDTIKISRVNRKRKLLNNTFLKKYRPVAGMARLYRHWERDGASFHYVSGSPWQLYPALQDFMKTERFPKGSFELRNFRVKDSSFTEFMKHPRKQKTRAIGQLLDMYPKREFVLVGDSGESDPEIYAEFARSYPDQILHILIRDVKDNPMTRERINSAFGGIDSMYWTIFTDAGELLPRQSM